MGTVHAEITLKNAFDEGKVQAGLIKAEDVRAASVTAVVDTGAMYLVITEELCRTLGLGIMEERSVKVADGRRVPCKLTEAVDVYWKDRRFPCPAIVVPGAESILLGAIPLEGMDLMINPKTQELVGVHGDVVEYMAYGLLRPY